jgi:hypothetical protein
LKEWHNTWAGFSASPGAVIADHLRLEGGEVTVEQRLWLMGLLWIALLGSCTPSKGTGPGASALTIWLEVPAEVRAGEIVPLKLKLKNSSDRPVELTLGGRPAYDFVVARPGGTEIWRWLHGQEIQAILEQKALSPGEELEFAAEWGQKDNTGTQVQPGSYFVRGILNLEPPQKLETEPKPLIVLP